MSFRDVPTADTALAAYLRSLRDDIDRLANGGAIKGQVSFDPVIRIGDVIVTAGDGTVTFTDALTGAVIDPSPLAPPAAATYLTGQVDSAGGVTAGTGFTVNRSGTGVYDITFDTAFASTPTVLISFGNATAGNRQMRLAAAAAGTCTVTVTNNTGTAADEPFNFVAFLTV